MDSDKYVSKPLQCMIVTNKYIFYVLQMPSTTFSLNQVAILPTLLPTVPPSPLCLLSEARIRIRETRNGSKTGVSGPPLVSLIN
jgi:hypothetical protein